MSTVTESVLSPTELQNLWQTINNDGFKPELAALMELLQWFRGDIRLGQTTSTGVGASATLPIDLQPPDNNEEWEILAAVAIDTAAIDSGDQVRFSAVDSVAAITHVLQETKLLAASTFQVGWQVAYPNRDNIAANTITGLSQIIGTTGWNVIARRRDKTTSFLLLRVEWKTTATIGTRTVIVRYIYRRRRLV